MELKGLRTRQDILDYIVPKLLGQGCLSIKRTNIGTKECYYRIDENTHCSIGWLIPNEYYRKEFEHNNVNQLTQHTKLTNLPTFHLANEDFLEDLQDAHDSLYTLFEELPNKEIMEELTVNLINLAKKYKLNLSIFKKHDYDAHD